MTLVIDNTGQNAGGVSTTTITISSFVQGPGTNRVIYLGVSQWKASDLVPTAKFNGSENFVFVDEVLIAESPGTRRVTVLKLDNPTVTTANIVISWSSAVDEAECGADSWVATGAISFGTAVKNSGTATSSSVVVPNVSGDIVHDTISADCGASASGTPNQTQRWKAIAASNTTEGDGQSAAGAGSNVTCTWSTIGGGTNFFAHIGFAIHEASSAVSLAPLVAASMRPSAKGLSGRVAMAMRSLHARTALPSIIDTTITPGLGQLTLAGLAPTINISANQTVLPGVGALTLTGFAPTVAVSNNITVTPGVGSLTLTGLAPIAVIGVRVFPGVGALTLTGLAPTVTASNNQVVTPGVGALTLSGLAPAVLAGSTVSPGVGVLTLTGLALTVVVTNNKVVTPGVGAIALTGLAPTVLTPVKVLPGVGVLTLTGFAPTILGAVDFILAGPFTVADPLIAVTDVSTRCTLTDVSPLAILTNVAPTIVVTPTEFP